ncbi:CDP-glucose 4,6-dehydratase [Cellulosilyticum sp. I15G10I2]|uniref:CDP-glucose 4,6-dehydratase n=1 Tax=Cellulosilyticum sp. I15G10I2 TaxID=1892843 RepID=UPI00085C9420|nr:CDP-glucose 4,6-dehydratase [Cellulosilyticum sp. I15G10I2]
MESLGVDFSKSFNSIFYGKRVLVTGHTGFKGSWLSVWLYLMGAKVIGYALDPASNLDNFVLCKMKDKMIDIRGDICNKKKLREVFEFYKPEIVFHLAAQPIVSLSYKKPIETLETNIIGTANILENIRLSDDVKAGVMITSDKCYENKDQIWGYREDDALGGFDPYSASKGCAEIITHAYRRSFILSDTNTLYKKAISSVRAGNVIGGGDWSPDRIIPDCIRALKSKKAIPIRKPHAVRPWQFVLEPLYGYLLIASKMMQDADKYSGAWNFGPDFNSVVPVSEIVSLVIKLWGDGSWEDISDPQAVHEAGLLNLDCTKSKTLIGFRPKLTLYEAIEQTLHWYKSYESEDVFSLCERQIADYCLRGSL